MMRTPEPSCGVGKHYFCASGTEAYPEIMIEGQVCLCGAMTIQNGRAIPSYTVSFVYSAPESEINEIKGRLKRLEEFVERIMKAHDMGR